MSDVEIEYCVPCGHLTRAIDTQRHLLEKFGQRLDGVRLKTGEGGVFTIRVGGEEIYDNTQKLDLGAIVDAVATRLEG